jgi:hypothetical protein
MLDAQSGRSSEANRRAREARVDRFEAGGFVHEINLEGARNGSIRNRSGAKFKPASLGGYEQALFCASSTTRRAFLRALFEGGANSGFYLRLSVS